MPDFKKSLISLLKNFSKSFARNSDLNAEKLTLIKEIKLFDGSKEITSPHSIATALNRDGVKHTDCLGSDSETTWGGFGKPLQSRRVIMNHRFSVDIAGFVLGFFGNLAQDPGLIVYNALINVCINSAKKKSCNKDEWLKNIYKAYHILRAMKENGVLIEEITYGPLLRYLVETGTVEEFEFFSNVIKEANPGASHRVGYYEMLIWIRLGNEDKVHELCNSIRADSVESGELKVESYLMALCESNRNEELVKLFSVIDVIKASSQDYLSNIFKSLGKRQLRTHAGRFVLALKASGATDEKLTHFIYRYAISTPFLVIDDVISEFEKLHKKFHVPPPSLPYGELIRKELTKGPKAHDP